MTHPGPAVLCIVKVTHSALASPINQLKGAGINVHFTKDPESEMQKNEIYRSTTWSIITKSPGAISSFNEPTLYVAIITSQPVNSGIT